MTARPSRRGFTLIELLVVIAIIAILAAILFPVFAQAREKARATACLSQSKQMGTAIDMYVQDFDETYPQAYYYFNNNNSSGGYSQWSGMCQPYIKNVNLFVCPSDKVRGLAPTNFIGDNLGYGAPAGQVSQNPGVQDNQVPRLSYTANAAIMPRKRRTVDPANVVAIAAVDAPADTIVIAEMTDVPSCINDTSAASGTAWKTHRSTNAVVLAGGGTFTGETEASGTPLEAITFDRARQVLAQCQTSSAAGLPHIAYTSPFRHSEGANYIYCDGHAKWARLASTLNPTRFQWGKRMYSHGGAPIYQPGTTIPVQ
jgi:prepilin-type N-terminal cleavage/methylation domain-containing protein/prepilin-type processing-associated H-X9-DG protein